MKKSCGTTATSPTTTGGTTKPPTGTTTPVYPGASGAILFNHNIPDDVKHLYQQCRYKGVPMGKTTSDWTKTCSNQNLPFHVKDICSVGCLMVVYSLVSTLELRYNNVNDKILPTDTNDIEINKRRSPGCSADGG